MAWARRKSLAALHLERGGGHKVKGMEQGCRQIFPLVLQSTRTPITSSDIGTTLSIAYIFIALFTHNTVSVKSLHSAKNNMNFELSRSVMQLSWHQFFLAIGATNSLLALFDHHSTQSNTPEDKARGWHYHSVCPNSGFDHLDKLLTPNLGSAVTFSHGLIHS